MKKLILTISLSLIGFTAFAQTAFEKAMTEKIAKVEDHKTPDEFTALANDFDESELKNLKNGFTRIIMLHLQRFRKGRILMQSGKTAELDPVAADAEKYI